MNRLFPDALLSKSLTGSEMLGAVLERQPLDYEAARAGIRNDSTRKAGINALRTPIACVQVYPLIAAATIRTCR